MGASVIGIDAATVGGAAAGRNGGLLRAGMSLFHHEARVRYGAGRAARMYAATVAERERLVRRFPALVRRWGYLRLAHDADERRDCRDHLDALHADGFRGEWYDGDLGAGLLVPDDAAVDPRARCDAEAGAAARAGARLYERTPAERLTSGRVETPGGVVQCRVIIVAVDGGLASLVPELSDRVRPMRLQMLASGPHEPGLLPHAIGTRWGWDYAQQRPDGVIAFGGCRDVGGGAEETADPSPTPEVQSALDRRFGEVTGTMPRVTHRWASVVGYTVDGLPVVEEVRPGIWAVGAYSGTGNLVGAVCGRVVARLATGREAGFG